MNSIINGDCVDAQEQRRYVGIDISEEYCDLARTRLLNTQMIFDSK